MKRYVILGGGVASVHCILGIREIDKEGEITLVSSERHAPYCRPLISYYLEGRTTPEKMAYRGEAFYEEMGVHLLLGKTATNVDKEKQEVTLDDGEILPYESLCLATGSSPFVPPMAGLDSVPVKFTFMTLDDALALEAALTPSARVFIIGAGLIGLKCAEGLYGRVGSITVCDLAGRVLSSILDDECAGMVQHTLEEKGLSFLLSDSVESFEGQKAFLKSGKEVDFDILVLAVGVRANTSLLKEAGGEVGRGILVDKHMQTSLPSIYAAGDCAEGFDLSLGAGRVLAILPNASLQGHTAGINMAGGNEVFCKGIPMNSIGFFGLHAMTAGTYEGECFEEKGEGFIRRLYYKDDLLKGFILLGRQERAGIYTSLIREKTPLSSINFDLMKKAATTAAFSMDERGRKFGGVV